VFVFAGCESGLEMFVVMLVGLGSGEENEREGRAVVLSVLRYRVVAVWRM
jgi:hypothetical protein